MEKSSFRAAHVLFAATTEVIWEALVSVRRWQANRSSETSWGGTKFEPNVADLQRFCDNAWLHRERVRVAVALTVSSLMHRATLYQCRSSPQSPA
jgi:hypothetical protein